MGILAFLVYLIFIIFRLDKVVNFRFNCIAAMVGLGVFHLLTYSAYPFVPTHVETFNSLVKHNKSGE